jgi:hypothetical protein
MAAALCDLCWSEKPCTSKAISLLVVVDKVCLPVLFIFSLAEGIDSLRPLLATSDHKDLKWLGSSSITASNGYLMDACSVVD